MRPLTIVWAAAAIPSATLTGSALIGLGMARHGHAVAVSAGACCLLLLPPVLASMPAIVGRSRAFWSTLAMWSVALFLVLPVYFPGERAEATATGLAVLMGDGEDGAAARAVAQHLPDEPALAVARLDEARPVVPEAIAARPELLEHQIALPFDGEGRRLSVPVVFEHGGRSTETYMMFDTGATYTTLPSAVLGNLDALPPPGAPVLTLNTANGTRTADLTVIDRVWLGDLSLDGVAVTRCEDCASSDASGLLGLNVAGAFNITIDADRREVVFSMREHHDRHLDVRPYTDLDGRFIRYPGGWVELTLDLANSGPRAITRAEAKVACGDEAWLVDVADVAAGSTRTVSRRLPVHEGCQGYRLTLERAWW